MQGQPKMVILQTTRKGSEAANKVFLKAASLKVRILNFNKKWWCHQPTSIGSTISRIQRHHHCSLLEHMDNPISCFCVPEMDRESAGSLLLVHQPWLAGAQFRQWYANALHAGSKAACRKQGEGNLSRRLFSTDPVLHWVSRESSSSSRRTEIDKEPQVILFKGCADF